MMRRNTINQYDKNNLDQPIHEIEREYELIEKDWLMLHYKVSVGMVAFSLLVECIMAVILINSDMLTTTVHRYVWKYILIPSGINLVLVALITVIMKSKQISQRHKIYTISYTLVAICFILFTVHNAFTATYYIFTVPILLTVIYASYRLTGVTAAASITALVISELFLKWDVDKASIFDSTLRFGDFLLSIFILVAISFVCMVLICYEQKKNTASIQMQLERKQLEQSLQIDELTGIPNRKALMSAMKAMEAGGYDNILAIADIDNFKGINDNLGHPIGDRCLIEFARILGESAEMAIPYRFGGDEFCLLFHGVEMEVAVAACKRIQLRLEDILLDDQPQIRLTASFGLAVYTEAMDETALFVQADRALYEAKVKRNTICFK